MTEVSALIGTAMALMKSRRRAGPGGRRAVALQCLG